MAELQPIVAPSGQRPPLRVVVTGASGFIGRALVARLARDGDRVLGVARSAPSEPGAGETAIVPDYAGADFERLLDGADAVVHAAGLAHVRVEAGRALAVARAANVEPVRALAAACARLGVRRLVLLGTVKVLGERTLGRPFTDADAPAPADAYARSKLEAETALAEAVRASRLEAVVLRLPLVYGPGVKGNMLRLLDWVARGWPLPLGAVNNRRSLLGLDNALSAAAAALAHPSAPGERFLVADDEALATPELVRRMARALGRPARLFPVAPGALRLAARAVGRSEALARLVESLEIDSSRIRSRLGWRPGRTLDEELAAMARWHLDRRGRAG